MDVESDESERWEDFFGSSTDLAPSVIGYYDRLSTEISSSVVIAVDSVADRQTPKYPEKPQKPPSLLQHIRQRPPQIVQQQPPNGGTTPRKQFRILSPTVQRLIASHEDTGEDHQQQVDELKLRKPIPPQKPILRPSQLQIPLSRNTCKLSAQSGSDLVDTYESSRQATELVEEPYSQSVSSSSEDLKTPTNDTEIFAYSQGSNEIPTVGRVKSIVQRLQSPTAEDKGVLKAPEHEDSIGEESCRDMKSSPAETCNFFVKLPPEQQEEIDRCRAATLPRSSSTELKSTYTRTKLFSNRPLPGSPKLLQRKCREASRPLSESSTYSISSTSSSSGEEIQSAQIGAGSSYLASVESLADHSDIDGVPGFAGSLTMCERAVMEIIDSEQCYVEDLGQVIRGYLDDWKERACLRLDDLTILFSNIREIYKFNGTLLERLKSTGRDPASIAKCFIQFSDKFDVYTTYCTSYPNAISLLTSLLQASHTNALLTSTQKLLQHNLPLGSYLLKPVQRILKYHLLLDNLRKHCDVAEVAQAYELMREVASNIDQVKRNLEQQSRVKELSGILDGWLGPELTVLGELRHEGMLMENSKPRAVFLFETMLIITKPKEDSRLQFKTYIKRQDIMLVEHLPGEPTSFNVIPYNDPRHQIKLTAKNREQKRLWAQRIKSAMLEDLNIPNRAKELVFKLGDEEDRTPPDKGVGRKWSQSSTPEYLERRNQYRRSEMRYRSKKARKNMTSSTSMDSFGSTSQDKSQDKSQDMGSALRQMKEMGVEKKICDHRDESCNCAMVKSQLTEKLKKRERSHSAEKLPNDEDVREMRLKKYSTLDGQRQQELPPLEINVYTAKTLPTRIAKIKKNKAKAAKETTSRFYRELNYDEPTELRITESTENLNPSQDVKLEQEDQVDDKEAPSLKNDAEIISDLLKESEEYKKLLKIKAQKQKSVTENITESSSSISTSTTASSSSSSTSSIEKDDKSTEENLKLQSEKMMERLKSIENDIKIPEPIYESLLRNVHVPYKSPLGLNRSISQNYSAKKKPPRPESDYVTLVYSGSELQSVGDYFVKSLQQSELSQLRNSDSNINYNDNKDGMVKREEEAHEVRKEEGEVTDGKDGEFERRGSFRLSKSTFLQRFMSVRLEDSTSNSSSSIPKSVKNTEMASSQSYLHKQGSESLGSRIAHVDYADPKTLFIPHGGNTEVPKTQRDSVFSLTSSNDSMNDSKSHKLKSPDIIIQCPSSPNIDDECYYEQKVEACLENDGFFRDSAVYSDDNERRGDFIETSSPNSPNSPISCSLVTDVTEERKEISEQIITVKNTQGTTSTTSTTKNWVMQQIKNFDSPIHQA